jgi:hypothetical protein
MERPAPVAPAAVATNTGGSGGAGDGAGGAGGNFNQSGANGASPGGGGGGAGVSGGNGQPGLVVLTWNANSPNVTLPVPQNTTIFVERTGTSYPAFLKPDWPLGQEHGDRTGWTNNNTLAWTHIALLPVGADVRDSYTGLETESDGDTVQVPDSSGTSFLVIFIERCDQGLPTDHKRAYLDRRTVNWPSNIL